MELTTAANAITAATTTTTITNVQGTFATSDQLRVASETDMFS